MLNLSQKQTEKWPTHRWSWKSLDRIRTQNLVLLIPHTVISNQTQTSPHLSLYKDLWNKNTGPVFTERVCVYVDLHSLNVCYSRVTYTGNVYTQIKTHTYIHIYTHIHIYWKCVHADKDTHMHTHVPVGAYTQMITSLSISYYGPIWPVP